MKGFRIGTCLFAIALASFGLCEIKYTVAPNSALNGLTVTMAFEAKKGPLEIQMPNWGPGGYVLTEPGKSVQSFTLTATGGTSLTINHPTLYSWETVLPADGPVTVSYTVPSNMEAGAMHYGGPATYMYIVGRKEEDCRLTLDVPNDWKIAVGLDQTGASDREYEAPTYDVLADNPVTMGDFIELKYVSHKKPHTIAIRGTNKNRIDQKRILEKCQAVSDSQGDFFGGLPFSKYIWHFAVMAMPDGAGGLEHLSSTQISLGYAVGPRAISVLAHEYFHLWNVKRIRSFPLGPFDYTQLPKTGALYWLEGTTDYYASLLNYRYGVLEQEQFLGDIVRNATAVRTNAARLRVSPYEASYRVGEANNGRGNSNGYEISYYNLGWLVGLVLDIEIRSRTNGKRSLDDVEHALWKMCKDDQPGFQEDEIRKQCVRFGGKEMGEFFDRVVMRPGELPLEESLAKVGFKFFSEQESYIDPGFTSGRMFRAAGVRIASVTAPGEGAGLKVGDVIVEVGGVAVDTSEGKDPSGQVNEWVKALTPGSPAKLAVMRDNARVDVTVTPVTAQRSVWRVTDTGTKDPAVLALRKGWFFAGRK